MEMGHLRPAGPRVDPDDREPGTPNAVFQLIAGGCSVHVEPKSQPSPCSGGAQLIDQPRVDLGHLVGSIAQYDTGGLADASEGDFDVLPAREVVPPATVGEYGHHAVDPVITGRHVELPPRPPANVVEYEHLISRPTMTDESSHQWIDQAHQRLRRMASLDRGPPRSHSCRWCQMTTRPLVGGWTRMGGC
jgi:hypothetical protein